MGAREKHLILLNFLCFAFETGCNVREQKPASWRLGISKGRCQIGGSAPNLQLCSRRFYLMLIRNRILRVKYLQRIPFHEVSGSL